MRFEVVTEIGSLEGNLAVDMDIYQVTAYPSENNGYLGECQRVDLAILLSLRTPVFQVGEILILNDDGREIDGRCRKPDKWDVRTQQVANLVDAAALVREIQNRAPLEQETN